MLNIFDSVPFSEKGFGKRQLVNEKHMLVMQIALLSGQRVPEHRANSNVRLLVCEGRIVVNLGGTDHQLRKGDLLPVEFTTPMHIRNTEQEKATFLVIKTPNPSEMKD